MSYNIFPIDCNLRPFGAALLAPALLLSRTRGAVISLRITTPPTASASAATAASTVTTTSVAATTTTATVAGHLNETWVNLLLGLSENVDEITSLLLV